MSHPFNSKVTEIILGLENNKATFQSLFNGLQPEVYLWKSEPHYWCLLEILCHLHDEEIEDFRTRVKHTLKDSITPPPPFDPKKWVSERNYIGKDYKTMLGAFIEERNKSIKWLRSLSDENWDNAFNHPKFGPLSAKMYLTNWLAHDYLHIRQILKRKYEYLEAYTNEDLRYAGIW